MRAALAATATASTQLSGTPANATLAISGTPGPWDAPRRVVAAGPYRWVRNPIYISALLVVLGQA